MLTSLNSFYKTFSATIPLKLSELFVSLEFLGETVGDSIMK